MSEITEDMFKSYSAYPLIFIHKKTNEVICETCARAMDFTELKKKFVFDIFYEGQDMICESCSEEIESAYGDPEEEEV
jgi:hypothetical protein